MTHVLKIAIIGAECTGKTTLAKDLTEAFKKDYPSAFVPEYLRTFVDQENRTPKSEEQINIALTQKEAEKNTAKELIDSNPEAAFVLLFCDTAPLLTSIYSEVVFAGSNPGLKEIAHNHDYDLTLFTQMDFPWIQDGMQRDGPVAQTKVHYRLKARLDELKIPYEPISGIPLERVKKTQKIIRSLLQKLQK